VLTPEEIGSYYLDHKLALLGFWNLGARGDCDDGSTQTHQGQTKMREKAYSKTEN
jgi:hypothetical protein